MQCEARRCVGCSEILCAPACKPVRLHCVQDHYENLYVVVAGSKTFFLKPSTSVHQMQLRRYPTQQEAMRSDLTFALTTPPNAGSVLWCPLDLGRSPAAARRRLANSALAERQHTCSDTGPACDQHAGGKDAPQSSPEDHSASERHAHAASSDASSCDPSGKATPEPGGSQAARASCGGVDWHRFCRKPPCLEVTLHAGDILYLPAMWYHYVMQDEGTADAVIAVNYWFDMRFGERYALHSLLQQLSEHAGLSDSAAVPAAEASEQG